MRKKTYRKLRKIAAEIYDLECTIACAGAGGARQPKQSERDKQVKLRRFYDNHPNKLKYDKIIGAYGNATCMHSFGQPWDESSHTYKRKFWRQAYEVGVKAQEEVWAKRRAYEERKKREKAEKAEDQLQKV